MQNFSIEVLLSFDEHLLTNHLPINSCTAVFMAIINKKLLLFDQLAMTNDAILWLLVLTEMSPDYLRWVHQPTNHQTTLLYVWSLLLLRVPRIFILINYVFYGFAMSLSFGGKCAVGCVVIVAPYFTSLFAEVIVQCAEVIVQYAEVIVHHIVKGHRVG